MVDYRTIPGFENLYLEDSWVLSITARPGSLELVVELVLCDSHPSYFRPAPGEQYCYRRGTVRFAGVTSLHWEGQGLVPAVDASGEQDYGSIDALIVAPNAFIVEGDFGRMTVAADPPSVSLE